MTEASTAQTGTKPFEFQCADCGELHCGSPVFGYDRPQLYHNVPEGEREARVKLSPDLCTIQMYEPGTGLERTHYFIRTTLDIPIHGAEHPFSWGVWVSVSEKSFRDYVATYNDDQTGKGCYGALTVAMPYYRRNQPGTPYETIPCNVNWGSVGKRPEITLQECDHPLYQDQQAGISWDKATDIARLVLHGAHS